MAKWSFEAMPGVGVGGFETADSVTPRARLAWRERVDEQAVSGRYTLPGEGDGAPERPRSITISGASHEVD